MHQVAWGGHHPRCIDTLFMYPLLLLFLLPICPLLSYKVPFFRFHVPHMRRHRRSSQRPIDLTFSSIAIPFFCPIIFYRLRGITLLFTLTFHTITITSLTTAFECSQVPLFFIIAYEFLCDRSTSLHQHQ